VAIRKNLIWKQKGKGHFMKSLILLLSLFVSRVSGSIDCSSGQYYQPIGHDLNVTETLASVTVGNCITICQEHDFLYSGLQNGDACYCGNVYGQYGDSSACTVNCTGNSTQICGGPHANSVYNTTTTLYVGCYADLDTGVCEQCQCEHGATCVSVTAGGPCICTQDFIGSLCEYSKTNPNDVGGLGNGPSVANPADLIFQSNLYLGIFIGCISLAGLLIIGVGIYCFVKWRRNRNGRGDLKVPPADEHENDDHVMEERN